MKLTTIKVTKLHPDAVLPKYSHGPEEDAGCDLAACLGEDRAVVIPPGHSSVINTGLCIELPPGYEAQIRSRSGLAAKKSVFVLNAPGTIDPSYRGPVGVILHNAGSDTFIVGHGDRIAQMVVAKYEGCTFVEGTEGELSETTRGAGGFGSTGTK